MPTPQIEQKLTALQSWVTAGICFIVVFAISVMAVMVWQASRIGNLTDETHSSLCAIKQDVEKRHAAGVLYLKDNPLGLISSRGDVVIPAALLRQSLENQQATLDALDSLNCE